LFILLLVPFFSYIVYPAVERFTPVTPLRKIGAGLFVTASSFLVVGWIEQRIQIGQSVSMWWQILAYFILTIAEVLVSITALEFSYRQAPLRMKSFIMALFLLSVSVGNLLTAAVNEWMVKPLQAQGIDTGAVTWVHLADLRGLVPGQKIDFSGKTGVTMQGAGGEHALLGTFLIGRIDAVAQRIELLDVVARQPLATHGSFVAASAQVSTYRLVGRDYFLFFAALMAGTAVVFVGVATRYRDRTHVRDDVLAAA
jgi:POT family proton-dependent oligopeptide transporter